MTDPLLEVARDAIKGTLHTRVLFDERSVNKGDDVKGVFVTLWGPGHRLRGCIGRHSRRFDSLAEEIADCAILSATEDPRFDPVEPDELADLRVEISLLSEPEPVRDPSFLDPKVYGVIVRSGPKQATLLPGIEGIDTVEQQLSAVMEKARIHRNEKIEMFRFAVRKIQE